MVLKIASKVALLAFADAASSPGSVPTTVEQALRLVRDDWHALEGLPEELKNDETVVTAAVEEDGDALQYASEELRATNAIVLAAVRRTGYALEFADESLTRNRAVVVAAVQQAGCALHFASYELKLDETVVLAAVRQDGLALEFVPEAMKRNATVLRAAVQANVEALRYVPDDMLDDEAFMLQAVQLHPRAFTYASRRIKDTNEAVVTAAVQQCGRLLQNAGPVPRDTDLVVMAALQQTTDALQFASARLQVYFQTPQAQEMCQIARDAAPMIQWRVRADGGWRDLSPERAQQVANAYVLKNRNGEEITESMESIIRNFNLRSYGSTYGAGDAEGLPSGELEIRVNPVWEHYDSTKVGSADSEAAPALSHFLEVQDNKGWLPLDETQHHSILMFATAGLDSEKAQQRSWRARAAGGRVHYRVDLDAMTQTRDVAGDPMRKRRHTNSWADWREPLHSLQCHRAIELLERIFENLANTMSDAPESPEFIRVRAIDLEKNAFAERVPPHELESFIDALWLCGWTRRSNNSTVLEYPASGAAVSPAVSAVEVLGKIKAELALRAHDGTVRRLRLRTPQAGGKGIDKKHWFFAGGEKSPFEMVSFGADGSVVASEAIGGRLAQGVYRKQQLERQSRFELTDGKNAFEFDLDEGRVTITGRTHDGSVSNVSEHHLRLSSGWLQARAAPFWRRFSDAEQSRINTHIVRFGRTALTIEAEAEQWTLDLSREAFAPCMTLISSGKEDSSPACIRAEPQTSDSERTQAQLARFLRLARAPLKELRQARLQQRHSGRVPVAFFIPARRFSTGGDRDPLVHLALTVAEKQEQEVNIFWQDDNHLRHQYDRLFTTLDEKFPQWSSMFRHWRIASDGTKRFRRVTNTDIAGSRSGFNTPSLLHPLVPGCLVFHVPDQDGSWPDGDEHDFSAADVCEDAVGVGMQFGDTPNPDHYIAKDGVLAPVRRDTDKEGRLRGRDADHVKEPERRFRSDEENANFDQKIGPGSRRDDVHEHSVGYGHGQIVTPSRLLAELPWINPGAEAWLQQQKEFGRRVVCLATSQTAVPEGSWKELFQMLSEEKYRDVSVFSHKRVAAVPPTAVADRIGYFRHEDFEKSFPFCSGAIVTNGGQGSVAKALRHGVPTFVAAEMGEAHSFGDKEVNHEMTIKWRVAPGPVSEYRIGAEFHFLVKRLRIVLDSDDKGGGDASLCWRVPSRFWRESWRGKQITASRRQRERSRTYKMGNRRRTLGTKTQPRW